jgi:diacylglycerol kinase family enzyme
VNTFKPQRSRRRDRMSHRRLLHVRGDDAHFAEAVYCFRQRCDPRAVNTVVVRNQNPYLHKQNAYVSGFGRLGGKGASNSERIMRVLLIHNPKAGDRKHSKKELMASLTRCGHQAFYQSTKERGWKKAFKKPVDLVIAAGGDGTVHETAWQIIDSGIPLAILPLGTANNLARSLGFTGSVDEILQSLHCGKSRPFDVGMARKGSQTDYFLEAAGGGLFADYFPAAKANKNDGASPEEELTAHLSLLRELSLDYPAREWQISIDGKDISGRYILWGAMNIRSAGPGLHLAPKAKTDDGRLDFVAVRERERQIFIKHVDTHLAGRKERVPLTPRKFRELKITSTSVAIHLDGEPWPSKKPRGRVEISVKRAALLIWHFPRRHSRD